MTATPNSWVSPSRLEASVFTFEKTDDGFHVLRAADGRSVCRVECAEVVHSDHLDGDPRKVRLAKSQAFTRPHPRADWRFHFGSVRLTASEVEALMAELPGAF